MCDYRDYMLKETTRVRESVEWARYYAYNALDTESPRVLMIGDAPGDFEAARDAGTLFYPIIPAQEEKSWEELRDKYFDMFINGEYTDEVQNELYNKFIETLK